MPKRKVMEEESSQDEESQLNNNNNNNHNHNNNNNQRKQNKTNNKFNDKNHREEEEEEEEEENKNNNDKEEEEEKYGMEDFKKGSIVRIKVYKFVTYDDCEFFPGPRLNVVIGPNGTGKSSIVCALALGLGGDPNILGRAKSIGEFVKHGATNGFIEIDIANQKGKKPTTIRREISLSNDSSWKINGKKASKAEVKKTVDDLNIQVDNLCQFLPQDKVVSFAGLSPQNLLRETEHVLGTSHLTNWHNQLIQLKKDEKELETMRNSHATHLEDLEKQQTAVRKDVLRFQERQKHLERLQQYEMKRPWIEFEVARLEASEFLKEKDRTKEAYDKFCRENRGVLQKKISQCKVNLETINKEKDANMKAQKEHDKKRRDLGAKIDSISDREDNFQLELQNLSNRAEDRKKQAEKMKKEISALKIKITELPNPEEAKRKTEEINQLLKENQQEARQIQEKLIDVQQKIGETRRGEKEIKDKLQTISDFDRQKMGKLNQNDMLKKVYDWVKEHKSQFERPVFGPVFLFVNVKDPLHASYLDNLIAPHIKEGFITQSARDREFISRECLDKLNLKVTIINNPPEDFEIRGRDLSPEQLHKYGFYGYLDQLFEAPNAVKQAILRNSAATITPAGSNKTIAADVLEQLRLSSFFTPDGYYASKTSKYGNKNTSTSFTALKPAKLLSGIDTKEKEKSEQELREITQTLEQLSQEQHEINQSEKELHQQRSDLIQEKANFTDVVTNRRKIENSLKYKEDELRSLNEDEDTSQEEERIRRDIQLAANNKLKSNHQMKIEILSITEKFLELDFIHLKRTELQSELQLLEFENRRISEEEEELRSAAEVAYSQYKLSAIRVKEAKVKAEAKVMITEEIKEMFGHLPSTLEEIDAAITDARNKADMNYSANPHIITQYEKRQAEIDDLKAKFESEETTLQNSKLQIEELKQKWEGELEPLISKVNKSFEKYFKQIGCLGEVVLAKDPNMDFEQYAIEIRVRFRDNEPLQKLDPNHQSGGERSVSTMLYLVSLQEITPCPFRLVDEINQGMDAVNERMIFQVVSEVACRPGVPQYFLITPKLLPNLKFTPEMTILCVFNGPWQAAHQSWRVDKFKEKAIGGLSQD